MIMLGTGPLKYRGTCGKLKTSLSTRAHYSLPPGCRVDLTSPERNATNLCLYKLCEYRVESI